jgi:hypothetical protein
MVKWRDTTDMALAEQQFFQSPCSPEWHDHHERFALSSHPLTELLFNVRMIAEHTGLVLLAVILKRMLLLGWLISKMNANCLNWRTPIIAPRFWKV